MNNLRNEGWNELWNFLATFFGDYWDGKKEEDIVDQVAKLSSREYFIQLYDQVETFCNLDITLHEKADFIRSANIYFGFDEQAIEWIELIQRLIKERIESNDKFEQRPCSPSS